jgi:AmmeMemoRadiSam system protein A
MSDFERFLTAEEERTLLRLARYVLERHVRDGVSRFSKEEISDFPITASLRKPSGVFVTYHLRGRLRGCIGSILPVEPLAQAVAENAVHSALHDPRFDPVEPSELEAIHIEISVMSDLIPVRDTEEVQVGRDGLVLRAGGRTGVFLPQVPTECGWDRRAYLEQLGLKAGLDESAYKRKDAILQRFTAQVFSEPKDTL